MTPDFNNTQILRVGDTWSGALSNFMVFEISSGSNEGVLLKLDTEECYPISVNIFDEEQKCIGEFDTDRRSAGQTVVARIPAARHSYFYAMVYTPEQNVNGKRFHISCESLGTIDEKDGNNEDFDTAQAITDNDQVLCWIDENDDWDMFRITCTGIMEGQETRFVVQPNRDSMRGAVYLYDSNRNRIDEKRLRGKAYFVRNVNPGDVFYLEVNYKGDRDGALRYLVYSMRDGEGGGIHNGGNSGAEDGEFKVLTNEPKDKNIKGGVELPIASNIWRSNKYLFYCDYPEKVHAEHLVENKCWLCREEVFGAGQAYLWHHNVTGQTIKSCLLVYNPNNFPIVVESTNYGTTNEGGASDAAAWGRYFTTPYSERKKVVIQPNSFKDLFGQTVSNGCNFGVVARTNVMTLNNTAAKAIFYDVAYTNSYIGADHWAFPLPEDGLVSQQCRGLAKSYYNVFYLGNVSPQNESGVFFKVAARDGADLVEISDTGKCPNSNKVEGSYGQQLVFNMNIQNVFPTAKKFKIRIGSSGGWAFPVIFAKNTVSTTQWIESYNGVDVIETDFIDPNSTMKLAFSMAIASVSASPFIIKVIPV